MLTTSARALRLLTIMLLLLGITASVPARADAQLNVTGQWATLPYLAPINPIHVAVLKDGKVLIVAGSENYQENTVYKAAVWDPATGTFSQQTTPWDLFCNGMSFLPDGRVIMTGGNLQYDPFYGPPWTTIFDPASETFYRVEDMAKGRWYPSNTPLKDGGTMTFGGLDEQGNTNTTVEIYDVGGGWSPPYPSNFTPGWYPRLHLLGNGKVFMGAPNPMSHTFNPEAGTWSSVGSMTNYADDRLYGSSVLLPLDIDNGYAPKVVIFGGNTNGATNSVEMIDLGVWPETWITLPPMSVPRVTMNAVLMPNGKILTLGGSTNFNDPTTAHLNAETFDPCPVVSPGSCPSAPVWTPSGSGVYARLYHSSALLLPDATVWVAGSNPTRPVWEPHMEIYKPPYLFTSTGAPAPRPAIGTAPAIIGYGQAFTVGTVNAPSVTKVLLMRPGSNTHAFDSEQRLIYMQFTKSADTLTVFSPTSMGAAPPGYYMLFIIDEQGVPSVATFLQLLENPTNQPPTATITSPSGPVTIAPGQSVTFAGTATDLDGSIALYSWNFPGGSPKKSTVQNPGAVTFATPGVYTVSFTVLDNLGANNPSPPTVTITVGSGNELGAAITSPANGATVSGTVTVNMAATNAQGTPTHFVLKLDNTTTLSDQSIASGSTATYAWDTTGVSTGSHTLNLTVTDGAGRTATAVITVNVAPAGSDPTPPTVAITAPASGATVSGSIPVTATASDNVGVVGVQFKLDGVNLGAEDTTAPYSLTWDTTTATPGTHTLTAVARDAAGNATTSAPVTVTVGTPGGPQNVVWTSLVKVAASGNTITKNAGCNGCWDAGAVSQQTIDSGNGSVEFTISAGTGATVGLSTGNTGTSANEIKFGLRFHPGSPGIVEVRESGAYKWDWFHVAGAVYKVAVEGGVVKYYQNGTLKYTSAGAPAYPLLVDATIDNVGNAVQAAVITGAGDTVVPTVTITAPAGGATVSGTSVSVSATASDNVGVVGVQFKLDGVNVGAEDTTAPYEITWDTTTATNGSHTLTAVARDAAGNTTTSAPVTVTADNDLTAPTVALTAPTEGATLSGTTVTASATASDNVAVVGVQFKLDGAVFGAEDTTAPYTITWDTTTAANGSHTLTAVARDAAGNTTTSAPVNVMVSNDTTAPTVAITAPAEGATVSGAAVTVTATASDTVGVVGVQFKVDGVDVGTEDTEAPYSIAWDTTATANGTHTLTAVARDAAGNTTTSAPITVTVVNGTGPQPVVWTSPVNVTVTGNTITKNAGCDGCFDAGAISAQTIGSGDGYVEFTTSDGAYVTVGLSNGNTGPAAEEIKFGLRFYPGTPGIVEVRESGVYKWDWLIVPGNVHRVAVEEGAVKYYQNGELRYTSALPPTYPLLLDSALGSPASAVQNAIISAGAAGDTTAPTVSIAAPASGATVSGAAVTVSATAGDDVGVVGVQFKLDGVNLGVEDTTAPYSITWDTTTATNGSHTLTAVARDAAGNTTTSAPVTVTVANGDSTPPTVAITAPAGGATVSGAAVTVSATASDDVGVVGVQFKLDGANLGVEDTTAPYSITWDTKAATNGSHTLTAVARDAAGNVTTSAPITVTVSNDTTAPTVAITAPAGGATVSGSAVTVSATATDDVGVVGVQLKLDGANLGTEDTTAPYAIAWDTTTATNGSHTLTAVARDAAGNTTTSAPITVTVSNDTTAPTVTITAPTGGATVSGNAVTVSATAGDDVGVVGVQFTLDGANLGAEDTTAPYAITWDTTAATNGSHTLTAVARDAAGNTTTSAPITVTVSNSTGPEDIVWTSAVNVAVTGNTITKNAGCDGCWDAGAISQQTIASGDGFVQFTVSAGMSATIGLSTGNTGTSGNEIKFGLRFYPGSPGIVEVRQSGVYTWDFFHVAGAVYKVAVEGGVVKYYQNGTLKYTSALAPTYPLLVDATLDLVGNAVQNAVIGP